ncbi:hypothetical protein B0T10DRAFT_493174 [Thelonectria olida]|uniref:DUF7704 domain-containing protein n=1 Tax=Thelonectria olida TaxID=1576542 RepID=A0A9P8VY47_9HYPO|nr:hypothetical protein B0T10DRAFT_493174 [Thelonectria olida]
MTQPKVHPFYRLWFTTVDPLSLAPTVLGLLFKPNFMMEGLIPATMSVPNPDHSFLFHHLAALYAFLALTLGGVLRATKEIIVWRVIVAGVLMVDLSIVASMFVSLDHQGRLGLATWRWQDWGNLLYTGGVAVIRGLFLANVGVEIESRRKKTA